MINRKAAEGNFGGFFDGSAYFRFSTNGSSQSTGTQN